MPLEERHFHNFQFTFHRLEGLEILSSNCSARSVLDCILQNKYLKRLDVAGINGNFEQFSPLENVEELAICGFENVPSDVVESFLTQRRSLKFLRICGIDDITSALESKISEKILHTRFSFGIDVQKLLNTFCRMSA